MTDETEALRGSDLPKDEQLWADYLSRAVVRASQVDVLILSMPSDVALPSP